jgi:V/A-type H+-transporting ATPase subunit D
LPEILQVNPTRMELLKQRQRLVMAQRAHDLLEDKRDELIQRFLPLVKEVREMRSKVRQELEKIYADFQISKMLNSEKEIEEALMWTEMRIDVEISGYTLTKAPQYKLTTEGEPLCYGFYGTNWKLDLALRSFLNLVPSLFHLAEKENEVQRLAKEIERTRRRVNALEYIFIPRVEQTVKHITMKLEERERAHIINLMKIKEMMEKAFAS